MTLRSRTNLYNDTMILKLRQQKKMQLLQKVLCIQHCLFMEAWGSDYNNKAQKIIGSTTVNPPIGKVTVAGTDYIVLPTDPYPISIFGKSKFTNQLSDNFRQSAGT